MLTYTHPHIVFFFLYFEGIKRKGDGNEHDRTGILQQYRQYEGPCGGLQERGRGEGRVALFLGGRGCAVRDSRRQQDRNRHQDRENGAG